MNNTFFHRYLAPLACVAGTFCMTLAFCIPAGAQTNSKGEEFFIVSSVDQKTHQLVLMRPTQLTVAAEIGPQTTSLGENGKKINPSTLRAGDTVWAVLKTDRDGSVHIVRIREGAMTEAELQKLYLHYSTSMPTDPTLPPLKPSPLNPPPQSGAAQPPASIPPVAGSNAMLRGQHRVGETHRRSHGPGGPARSNS